jgi:type IV pilus assembly protein PilO
VKSIGRRETVVIGVLVMVLVIVAGWFFLIKPTSSKVSNLKKQAAEQEQTNEATRNQIAVLEGQKKQLPADEAELSKLAQRVPSSVELPSLLRQMQQAAEDSGVTLVGITPTQPAPLTGANGIDAVGITLVVKGGYAEVEEFDSTLENLSRAFLVSGFTFASTSGSGGSSTSTSPGSSADESDKTVNATFNGRVLLRSASSSATSSTPSAQS